MSYWRRAAVGKSLISILVLIVILWAAKTVAYQVASTLWWVGLAAIALGGFYAVIKIARKEG